MRPTLTYCLGTVLATLPLACLAGRASSPHIHQTGTGAIVQVQQTLNLFPLSVDSKNYTILSEIFTEDAIANFQLFPIANGLPAIVDGLSRLLAPLVSQHSYTTQEITLDNGTDGSAITYLQGNFFGQGNLTGQVLNNYGKYLDDLTFVDGVGWRVRNRTLITIVSFLHSWVLTLETSMFLENLQDSFFSFLYLHIFADSSSCY